MHKPVFRTRIITYFVHAPVAGLEFSFHELPKVPGTPTSSLPWAEAARKAGRAFFRARAVWRGWLLPFMDALHEKASE